MGSFIWDFRKMWFGPYNKQYGQLWNEQRRYIAMELSNQRMLQTIYMLYEMNEYEINQRFWRIIRFGLKSLDIRMWVNNASKMPAPCIWFWKKLNGRDLYLLLYFKNCLAYGISYLSQIASRTANIKMVAIHLPSNFFRYVYRLTTLSCYIMLIAFIYLVLFSYAHWL